MGLGLGLGPGLGLGLGLGLGVASRFSILGPRSRFSISVLVLFLGSRGPGLGARAAAARPATTRPTRCALRPSRSRPQLGSEGRENESGSQSPVRASATSHYSVYIQLNPADKKPMRTKSCPFWGGF
jgi:hypothetical protein